MPDPTNRDRIMDTEAGDSVVLSGTLMNYDGATLSVPAVTVLRDSQSVTVEADGGALYTYHTHGEALSAHAPDLANAEIALDPGELCADRLVTGGDGDA